MTKTHEIVKVQMPVESSEETPKALVYTEGKKFMDFLTIDNKLKKKMGTDLKVYFYADIEAGGEVTLHGRAPWQSW